MSENIKNWTKSLNVNWKNIATFIITAFVIAISSQISIPLPNGVPMTLQTFIVALVGFSLSSKEGLKAIVSYLFLGMIGLPVFAQDKAGTAVLFGLTGGFLFGFIFFVFCCSKAKKANHFLTKLAFSAFGLFLCHLFGVLQYSILTGMNIFQATMLVSVPFLLKDGLSVLLAFILSEKFNFNLY